MASEFRLSYTAADINEKLGKIDSFANKSELPSKLSELTNDKGFATEQYVDDVLANKIPTPATAQIGQTIVVKSVDENGKPVAWECVDIPEQVQSDWSQNDSDAPNYIKNKPEIATDDEIIEMLVNKGFVEPVTDNAGDILTNANGDILIL
jgi:hypothetical protein